MNIFVLGSVLPDTHLRAIFAGVTSFVITNAVALAIAFPAISIGPLYL